MNDLKPFLKKIYENYPMQIKASNIKELQEKIVDAIDTYLGYFRNGRLYFGTNEAIPTYELSDLIDMTESDVEDYMEYVSAISLSSQCYYKDNKIQKGTEWCCNGLQDAFTELLKKNIDNFIFLFEVRYIPDLFQCECKTRLFYDDDTLNIEFKIKDLSDKISQIKKKKYTGYYSSKDGSMDAQIVIDKFDLNFCRGNIFKYIVRAGRKDPTKEIEDLQKAREYVDFEIRRIKNQY